MNQSCFTFIDIGPVGHPAGPLSTASSCFDVFHLFTSGAGGRGW